MIQSFNKRLIRSRAQREAKSRAETRDAVLWEVLPDQRVCWVKVQGSDTKILATYPENWGKTPDWLKPGNSVKILHTTGNRNRVELIGNGSLLPTPLAGAGATGSPVIGDGVDTVIEGCTVSANFDTPGMNVLVSAGTYRIAGDYYALGSLTMLETNTIDMTSGIPMDGTFAASIAIPAADSTRFRFDAIVVGVDGVLDLVSGPYSETNPQMPDVPAGHLMVGWVLVLPGSTAITQYMINVPFVAPFVSQIQATPIETRLTWAQSSVTFDVHVQDQYGRDLIGTNWGLTATIIGGTGTMGSGTTATSYTGTSDAETSFTYRRLSDYTNPLVIEFCPVFIEITLIQDPGIINMVLVLLEDSMGFLIYED